LGGWAGTSRRFFDKNDHQIDGLSMAMFVGLGETIRLLNSIQKRVLIEGAPPEFPFDSAGCLLRDNGLCAVDRSWKEADRREAQAGLERAISGNHQAHFVNLFDALCPASACTPGNLNEPLLSDSIHLSKIGARRVLPLLTPYLDWLSEGAGRPF
jgi:hypothetical protein